ncbi:MAG: hypothetical protein CMP33_07585 [Rickettsiales bacterium]|nr:hypothetical protein [Rickettsiales bacterium]|tara:strand:- start:4138 stop:4740 length:603 start_codon:yes stop_codon:yes gene_type:complete
MANMKHIGRIKKTGRKVAVVFRTIPGDPDSALVVQTENIKDADHDKLMTLIESNTGQTADELADAMTRTPLGDGSMMLNSFHLTGKLTKVSTSDIEMTPDTASTISLDELNKMIAEQKGVSVADLAVGGSSVETIATAETVPSGEASATVEAAKEQPLSDEQLANNMRADADRLFKEATELRKQAEDLDPSKSGKSSGKA